MSEVKLGATGEFPDGKVHESDEGELNIMVAEHRGLVVVEFGKSVKWLGLDPSTARSLAKSIERKAEIAEKVREVQAELDAKQEAKDAEG